MGFAAGLRLPLHIVEFAASKAASRLGLSVLQPIPFFVLKVTDVCNARCETCNLGLPSAYRSSASLPLSVATSIVQEMARRKTLFAGIVGGEPLLYKHLYELLEMCQRLGVRTNLNTHGAFLTKDAARRLGQVGLSYASISLDYPDADRNEAVRKGIKFEAVLDGIRNIKRESPSTAVSIGMTVTRQNISAMGAMAEFVAREGVQYLKFQPFHSHLDQMTNEPTFRADMAIKPDDLPRLSEELVNVQQTSRSLGLLTNARMLLQELPAAISGRRVLPCVAGDAILFVEPSGRVGGCPERRSSGSLKDMDLDKLMETEPDVFTFANGCPILKNCFDTTYGELSHILGRNDIRRTLDVIDRVLFYR